MKQLLILSILIVLCSMRSNAQQIPTSQKKDITDSLIMDLKRDILFSDSLTRSLIQKMDWSSNSPRYKIYSTENIYTLLRLDTRTGQVSQVQYRTNDTDGFSININYGIIYDSKSHNGRFELYPTKNMYTFIMIDTYSGDLYQVQWSTKKDKRFVERIY